MPFDSIKFPFSYFILYSLVNQTLLKILKFYVKHYLEVDSNSLHKTAPVSEIAPVR